MDLNVVSVSDIKNMPRLTTDHNKILKFIKIYSPNPNKDINENYLIVNAYNCYSEKEKLKENGYFWNGTLKAWYKKIKKEDQIKEQNYLNSLNLTDIQFADGNKIILKN